MNLKDILLRPIITEKSLQLAGQQNYYTFQVTRTATKTQIKKAIERYFGVKVTRVNTVTVSGEIHRQPRSRKTYRTPNTKKAFVQLSPGQTLDLFQTKNTQSSAKAPKK